MRPIEGSGLHGTFGGLSSAEFASAVVAAVGQDGEPHDSLHTAPWCHAEAARRGFASLDALETRVSWAVGPQPPPSGAAADESPRAGKGRTRAHGQGRGAARCKAEGTRGRTWERTRQRGEGKEEEEKEERGRGLKRGGTRHDGEDDDR